MMSSHRKLAISPVWKHLIKHCYTSALERTSLLLQCIDKRGLLRLNGEEVENFLQGLITNDVNHLKSGATSMYSMFLNSRGRVLYDTIIYKTEHPNTFLIECDTAVLPSLKKHLMIYRVRKKIDITSLENDTKVWVLCPRDAIIEPYAHHDEHKEKLLSLASKLELDEVRTSVDPRVSNLGLRILAPDDIDIIEKLKKLPNVDVRPDNFYKHLRYKLGVGEGESELPPGNCLPLEANCDYLHGVSFHKGCYIGQELTARTHHTGVIRKRLMPLTFKEKIQDFMIDTPILSSKESEKSLGKLKGAENHVGLALLRIEEVLKLPSLTVDGKPAKTFKPLWWPTEAPKDRIKAGLNQ